MLKRFYLLSLLIVMAGSSCKDFLDTLPTDFLAPETYYNTEADLNYARAGVYHNLGAGPLYGTYAHYLLGWGAEEAYMDRASPAVGPWRYNYTSTEPYSTNFWANLYNGINRANELLANIDKNPAISQEFRDRVRGEVLFLRGYYYFMLVQYYGGVPLKLSPTTSVENVDIPRASIREVYDQILKDMEAAEPLVANIKTIGFGGQVSKSAVRGILARVNLYMAGHPLKDASRYAEVIKWTKMVMDDAGSGHALNPDYSQIFINYSADLYDTKESIWEVEFWGNRSDEYTETTFNGYINGPGTAAGSASGQVIAYMKVTNKLYNSYADGDMRKFWNITFFNYTATGPSGSKNLTNESTTEAAKFTRSPAKFRREYERVLPKFPTQTPINMPILRYADILLMYAEAENALNGPTPAAIEAVNKVRQRGYAIGGIKNITVTNRGSNYTVRPTITFTGDGGGASATATIGAIASNRNQVVSIALNRDSTGVSYFKNGRYSSPPTVNITGVGSGASAVANLYTIEDANVTAAQTASQESFLQLIQEERMREFFLEGLRKADLLRWGIFVEAMQDMGNVIRQHVPTAVYLTTYTNVQPKHVLMPIPANEVNTNLKITQNPGWE